MFDKNEQLTRQHTARRISIEKSKDTVHQLFREIVTQLSSSFLLQRDQFRRWHRVYAITLRNEVISVRNNARACSQNRGARKGPLARTINAKRWSDPTNGTRSERTNRSQFVTIGTCTSLSFETATSCVPSPLPHHPRSPFYADPERQTKEKEREEDSGKKAEEGPSVRVSTTHLSAAREDLVCQVCSLFASNRAECSGIISPFVSTSSYFVQDEPCRIKGKRERERDLIPFPRTEGIIEREREERTIPRFIFQNKSFAKEGKRESNCFDDSSTFLPLLVK